MWGCGMVEGRELGLGNDGGVWEVAKEVDRFHKGGWKRIGTEWEGKRS